MNGQDTLHDLDTVLDAIHGTGAWERGGKAQTSGGVVANVAQRLNVSRQTIYNYLKKWKTAQQALNDERAAMVDLAENKLYGQVNEGNITAIIFTLKASPEAKHRGWGEETVLKGREDQPLRVAYVNDWRHEESND